MDGDVVVAEEGPAVVRVVAVREVPADGEELGAAVMAAGEKRAAVAHRDVDGAQQRREKAIRSPAALRCVLPSGSGNSILSTSTSRW